MLFKMGQLNEQPTHRSSGGAAAVGRALAGPAKDVDGAAKDTEQAGAADGALVVVGAGGGRVVGAGGQEVNVLSGGEGGGGHGEGQDGDDAGELHFGGWWMRSKDLEKMS